MVSSKSNGYIADVDEKRMGVGEVVAVTRKDWLDESDDRSEHDPQCGEDALPLNACVCGWC